MVCVLLRETASLLTFIMNIISVNFIACFQIICWFLQTLNYRGNEKYVLVLVQCHDGMITNSINLVCVLHSFSTRDQDQTDLSRLWSSHHDTGLEPEPNILFTNLFLFKERHAAKTVGEIKQFVSKLPHMQAAKQSLATRKSAPLAGPHN